MAENGADAGLVRGKRRREVGDNEERRSGVGDPRVAGEVREEIDGGIGEGRGGWNRVGSEEREGKVIDGVHLRVSDRRI